jgi:NAD(P)-dependent dehydrogenase (short-subunit alcohol dehydrogenase family)
MVSMSNEKKIALITGASSGIGRETAKVFVEDGFVVYGTSRNANYEAADLGGVCCTMLPMELKNEGSIKKAVEYVIEKEGHIDVAINAAGGGIAGAIEETTIDEAKFQFDNFFGALAVINNVLPYMRKAGSGSIINIGSMAADFPIAFQGLYSSAKSALFMMTAVLRMEVKPFGIKACVVEPGDTKTGFTAKRVFTEKSKDTAYRKPLERALYEMIRSELSSPGPEECAKLVLKAAKMKNPPARVSVGFQYKILYALSRLTSWKLKFRILEMMYLKKDPPENAIWTYGKQFGEK